MIDTTALQIILLPRRRSTVAIASLAQAYLRDQVGKPSAKLGKVLTYGTPTFISDVTNALTLLKQHYSFGYSLVQRYIFAIEEGEPVNPRYLALGVRYEKPTPDGHLQVETRRYAAILVRLAVELRCVAYWGIPKTSKFDMLKLSMDLRAMKRIGCHPRFHRVILNQIATIKTGLKFKNERTFRLPESGESKDRNADPSKN